MQSRNFLVYKTTNLVNGQFYIGVHISDDLEDDYLGSGTRLRRSVEKYGRQSFKRDTLYVFDNVDEMFQKEAELINEDLLKDPLCLNIIFGGSGGWGHGSHEVRSKIYSSENQKKRSPYNDPEWVDANKENRVKWNQLGVELMQKALAEKRATGWRASGFTGRQHTQEYKDKLSETMKEKQSGSSNSQYGTCWIYSNEQRISKKIPATELATHVAFGWLKGRKMNFAE